MASNRTKTSSEPDYAKGQERAKVPYYSVDISHRLPPETQELLENYSHVPRGQQLEHIHIVRDKAWDIRQYPCIGLGSFLTPQLRRLPVYPELLSATKSGAVVLDVGTFVGHDLRRLVYDGAPSTRLYGVDIANHFDVGYEFFQDRDTFKGKFILADFHSSDSDELNALKEGVDVVVMSQVLHQWDLPGQTDAAKVLAGFTKGPGSMVVGNQIGNSKAQHVDNRQFGMKLYRHNVKSFRAMWDEVGVQTGTKWETEAWERSFENMGWDTKDHVWMEKGVCLLEFVARRVV